MYTPGFAPPELYVKGAPLGPWSDIYSIGAALFACMSGGPPQAADARKNEDKMGPRFDYLATVYSPELAGVVRACLALDPMARPRSVFEVQKVLQTAPATPLADEPANDPAPPAGGQGGLRGLFNRLGGFKRAKSGND